MCDTKQPENTFAVFSKRFEDYFSTNFPLLNQQQRSFLNKCLFQSAVRQIMEYITERNLHDQRESLVSKCLRFYCVSAEEERWLKLMAYVLLQEPENSTFSFTKCFRRITDRLKTSHEQNSVAMVKANMKTFIELIKEDDEIYTLALEVIKTMEEKE